MSNWPDKPDFSEKELSELVDVSVRQLQRLREKGYLPYSRPGRAPRYTRQDWEDCLRNTRRVAAAQAGAGK